MMQKYHYAYVWRDATGKPLILAVRDTGTGWCDGCGKSANGFTLYNVGTGGIEGYVCRLNVCGETVAESLMCD